MKTVLGFLIALVVLPGVFYALNLFIYRGGQFGRRERQTAIIGTAFLVLVGAVALIDRLA